MEASRFYNIILLHGRRGRQEAHAEVAARAMRAQFPRRWTSLVPEVFRPTSPQHDTSLVPLMSRTVVLPPTAPP